MLSHPPTHWSFVLEEFRPNRQSDPEAPEKTLNYSGSAILTATTSSPTLTAASPLAPRGASASDTQQVTGEALAALLHHQPQPIFLCSSTLSQSEHVFLLFPLLHPHTAHNMEHDPTMYSNLQGNFTILFLPLIDRERVFFGWCARVHR